MSNLNKKERQPCIHKITFPSQGSMKERDTRILLLELFTFIEDKTTLHTIVFLTT
jgi:hypothetical protein